LIRYSAILNFPSSNANSRGILPELSFLFRQAPVKTETVAMKYCINESYH
jgi:hypothetical protein